MHFKSMREILSTPEEEIKSVIQPVLLPVGGIGVITGEPGIGKSFLMQQTTFELSCGHRWLGLFPVMASRVGYLETEKRSAVSRNRFRKELWFDRFPQAKDSVFYYDEEMIELDTIIGNTKLMDMIMQKGIDLLIIDSISTIIGDETQLPTMKAVFKNLREITTMLGITIICIQHLKKRDTQFDKASGTFIEPPLRMDDLRGSKFIQYDADLIVGVVKTKREGVRELAFLKHSHSPISFDEKPPFNFMFNGGAVPPFVPHGRMEHSDEVLRLLDLADAIPVSFLMDYLGLSRPTLRDGLLKCMEDYGLIRMELGGGRGAETLVYKF